MFAIIIESQNKEKIYTGRKFIEDGKHYPSVTDILAKAKIYKTVGTAQHGIRSIQEKCGYHFVMNIVPTYKL